jgi:hypothetical protein
VEGEAVLRLTGRLDGDGDDDSLFIFFPWGGVGVLERDLPLDAEEDEANAADADDAAWAPILGGLRIPSNDISPPAGIMELMLI